MKTNYMNLGNTTPTTKLFTYEDDYSPVELDAFEKRCLANFELFIRKEKSGLKLFYNEATLAAQARIGAAMMAKLAEQGCGPELAQQLSILALYNIVILIDDSSSMELAEQGTRKITLQRTLEEITNVYDLANPDGLLSVRFLNAERGKRNVTNAKVAETLDGHTYSGVTRLGTELDGKVLNRFVWGPRAAMKKPLLVMVMTDGEVEGEKQGLLQSVILNCVTKLKSDPKLGPHAVAFHFSRIGHDIGAAELLKKLDQHPQVGRHVDCLLTEPVEKIISEPDEKWPVLAKLLTGAIVAYWDRQDNEIEYGPDGDDGPAEDIDSDDD